MQVIRRNNAPPANHSPDVTIAAQMRLKRRESIPQAQCHLSQSRGLHCHLALSNFNPPTPNRCQAQKFLENELVFS